MAHTQKKTFLFSIPTNDYGRGVFFRKKVGKVVVRGTTGIKFKYNFFFLW